MPWAFPQMDGNMFYFVKGPGKQFLDVFVVKGWLPWGVLLATVLTSSWIKPLCRVSSSLMTKTMPFVCWCEHASFGTRLHKNSQKQHQGLRLEELEKCRESCAGTFPKGPKRLKHLPSEDVFRYFLGLSTFSGGVWTLRDLQHCGRQSYHRALCQVLANFALHQLQFNP